MVILLFLVVSASANPYPTDIASTDIIRNGPTPYVAKLELRYNGKLQSHPIAKLESLGNDRYRYTLTAVGDKGLAWLARAKDKELGEFRWNNGKPQPLIFQRKLKFIGKNDNWFTTFDWQANRIMIRHNSETMEQNLRPRTLDPVTFLFRIQSAVANGETHFQFPIMEKDKLKQKHFSVVGEENLQTAVGCLPTIIIERRKQKNGKFQRHWLAPDFQHFVVRTDTGKPNKPDVSLVLKKLSFQGRAVEIKNRCQISGS